MKLTIGHIYPDLLNLYGDRGNVQSFAKRLSWRGIDAEVISYLSGDAIDLSKLDIIMLGGGSHKEQVAACNLLRPLKDELKSYIENDGVILAVCGGFHMLGTSFETADGKAEGLGILDITSTFGKKPMVGNIRIDTPLMDRPLYGFENHYEVTDIGSYKPFGKVTHGFGNGLNENEGIMYKNLIGTNIHGPLLPKNPEICDLMLKNALEKKYNKEINLEPLDDSLEAKTNEHVSILYTEKEIKSRH